MREVRELVREADVTLPLRRELECYLHDQTLKDLVAVHLQTMCLVASSEEVTNLTIGPPNKDGTRTLRFNIEPDQQIIQHN